MKLNKEDFLKTEVGALLRNTVEEWDRALGTLGREHNVKVISTLAWCQARWTVFQAVMRQFYDRDYFFSRTDEYYGICTDDQSDWLFKIDREGKQLSYAKH